jgi:hypothetical protein
MLACLVLGGTTAVADGPMEEAALPVLDEGPWAGKNAAFYTDNFEAVINPDASLSVHFKAWRTLQTETPPVTFRLVCFYRDEGGTEVKHRSLTKYRMITKFTKVPEPQEFRHKRRIVIEGLLEGDIPFRVEYSFEKNQVNVTGGVDDEANPFPSRPSIRVEMPEGVGNPVDYSTLGKLVGDFHLETQRFDGTNFPWDSFTYLDTPALDYAVYQAKVWGQFGPRLLTFETHHTGGLKGFGEGHNRVKLPLWRGYNFWMELRNDSLESKGRTFTLDVE